MLLRQSPETTWTSLPCTQVTIDKHTQTYTDTCTHIYTIQKCSLKREKVLKKVLARPRGIENAGLHTQIYTDALN